MGSLPHVVRLWNRWRDALEVRGPVAARNFCSSSESPAAAPGPPPKPHPMSKRFAFSNKPFFPVISSNMRDTHKKKRKKKRGRGKSCGKGIMWRKNRGAQPRTRTFEGGTAPLFIRTPKWPAAANQLKRRKKSLEPLNLSKLRNYLERGRLDARFPITQRHLYESKLVTSVTKGVGLFNVNDFPFPYKIDIEVAGADQSSVDVIKAVGGSVTIVYMDRVTLRAHVKPWRFEVLPRTARPTLKMVHYLERMKARGAMVRYIKPLWLIEEERRLQTQLRELQGEEGNVTAEQMARENERLLP